MKLAQGAEALNDRRNCGREILPADDHRVELVDTLQLLLVLDHRFLLVQLVHALNNHLESRIELLQWLVAKQLNFGAQVFNQTLEAKPA